MGTLTYTEAFAKYGAKPVSVQWAISAIAGDGAFVMSCWAHNMFKHEGKLRYEDNLSCWEGNASGSKLLREHLEQVKENDLPVRLLIATLENPKTDRDELSSAKKKYHVRPDLIGKLVSYDGESFIIDFERNITAS